jgi:hypothetical protein
MLEAPGGACSDSVLRTTLTLGDHRVIRATETLTR